MAVDYGIGKYGTSDRIPNRNQIDRNFLGMGTADKMVNAYHPSRHLPEHLRVISDIVRPPSLESQGITVSPIGFGNASRGQDPMGPTGTISNSYQVPPIPQALGEIIQNILYERLKLDRLREYNQR